MQMNHAFAIAFALSVVSVPLGARAAESPAQQFTDQVCERATSVGRRMNDIAGRDTTLTPELMAAAVDMKNVYEDCVQGYDRDQSSATGHGGEQYANTNGALIGRLYSRLALARALQRLAMYDEYAKNYGDAKANYQEAVDRLDQMTRVESYGDSHPGSSDRNLLEKGKAMRPTLVAAETALPNAMNASPAPANGPVTTPVPRLSPH